jgi:hypothetical protein
LGANCFGIPQQELAPEDEGDLLCVALERAEAKNGALQYGASFLKVDFSQYLGGLIVSLGVSQPGLLRR